MGGAYDDPKESSQLQRLSLWKRDHEEGKGSGIINLARLCCYSLDPYVYVFSLVFFEKIRTGVVFS